MKIMLLAVMLLTGGGAMANTNGTLYVVGYAHLDTQWRWTYHKTIGEYLPATMSQNFPLFEKYPDYIFNFSGANRYRMMKEYYPADYAKVGQWVRKGRWFPCGSAWEESDVNVPASESLLRQLLYGHNYFKSEFGTESAEYMLPDCFGFPASLPSILAHCGLRGFSTQKLTWGSAMGIPFKVGVWKGIDGNGVIAALDPGEYVCKINNNLSFDEYWRKRIENNGRAYGLYCDYHYYGVGDVGGAPTEDSVKWMETSIASNDPVCVVSSKADQMFLDISDEQRAKLPTYTGDLLLTEHSAGSISSQAYMKRWNRMNELLADAAERASVAAHLLGATPYPHEKLYKAWGLVLGAQFHDILPGTSEPAAYELSWNDEIVAMNSFAAAFANGVGAVTRALDTSGPGTPLVVFNPLSVAREDVVEAKLDWPVRILGPDGVEVPAQRAGTNTVLFLAKVPAVSFSVFSVVPGSAATESELKVTDRSLENERYRVTINDAGDIASVFDKKAGKELLAAPARLAFQHENPRAWPASSSLPAF